LEAGSSLNSVSSQQFRIRCDRILSIRRIWDFWKSGRFRWIQNPSHPYYWGVSSWWLAHVACSCGTL